MTPFAQSVTALLSLGVIALNIISVFLVFVLINYSKKSTTGLSNVARWISKHALLLLFLISLSAVVGSEIYSLIIGFIPCELCWWQRIFLFPQPIILGIALWHKKKGSDENIFFYTFALSLVGAAIAAFHYYGQIFNPAALAACEASGISCSKLYFTSFGFITIPYMALSTFVILILIALTRKIAQS